MKRCLTSLMLGLLILTTILVNAQAPVKIPYQAVLRTPDGEILANQPTLIQASVIVGQPTDNPVFSETHSVVSSPFGIISIILGNGVPVLGTMDDINWKSGVAFLKIEIDYQNSGNYLLLGVSQILSVPYALQSGNSLNQLTGQQGQIISHDGSDWQAYDKVWVNPGVVTVDGATTKNPEDAIFQIKNQAGETLFNVTHQGVEINLPDDGTSTGSMQVSGLSTGNNYLYMNPDSVQIQFNTDGSRSEKGGFAVGGLSSGKVLSTPYFLLMPEGTLLNFDKAAAIKSEKGGFAVGGLSNQKISTPVFTIEPDCTRMYIASELERAEKGGFAVGGLSSSKPLGQEYFRLSSLGAQVAFDEESVRSEKGGFAVGGLSNSKTIARDYLNLSQEGARFEMAATNQRAGIGGFNIGGYMNNGEEFFSFFNLTPFTVTINTGTVTTGEINIGGDVNVGGEIIFLPEISTDFVAEYDSLNATVFGTLIADGGGDISSYGLVWGTQPLPTPTENVGMCTIETVEFVQFMCQLANLNFSTTYYVRAFATNSAGTAYGDELSFTTFSQTAIMPKALTLNYSDITDISALAHGEIVNPADSSYLSKGFVYNTSGSPTLVNNSQIVFDEIQSNGMFSMALVNLLPGTTYYFRAFVMHSEGVGYGDVLSFTTPPAPTITAPVVEPLFDVHVFATATVVSEPMTNVVEAGFVWSTSADVNTDNYLGITSHLGTTGEITDSIGGLEPNTGYFIRSYVIHSSGTYLSNVQFFTTKESPSIITNSALAISDTEIEANATITTNNCQVIAYGFVWDKNDNPTLENSPLGKTRVIFSGETSYNTTIDGFLPDSTYFIRSYVEHLAGVSYDISQPVQMLPLPTVTMGERSNITDFSVFANGNLSVQSGVRVDSVGFIWSSHTNTIFGSEEGYVNCVPDETGNFSANIEGLLNNNLYYIRSFVRHSQGFSYSNEEFFLTLQAPTCITNPVTDLTDLSAKLHATVFVPANTIVLNLGFEYTATTFTAGEMNTISLFASWMNETEISHQLTGLVPGTVYQVRAFVQHNNGTSYGGNVSFETFPSPYTTTDSVIPISDVSAVVHATGHINAGITLNDIGFQLTTTDFDNILSTESVIGTYVGNGVFQFEFIDLAPSTTYFVRTYLNYINGDVYSEPYEFSTLTSPSVSTISLINVEDISLEAHAEITNPDGATVLEVGFQYTATDFVEPDMTTLMVMLDSTTQPAYTAQIINLIPATEYKIRAYLINNSGTVCGDILTSTTKTSPTVETFEITNISDISADARANITNPDLANVLEVGFQYTTTDFVEPDMTTITISLDSATQVSYSNNLTGLLPGTEYKIRAYLASNSGTVYGTVLTATTKSSPSVSTAANNITDISANITGIISNPDLADIINAGFQYTATEFTEPDMTTLIIPLDSLSQPEYTTEISGLTPATEYKVRTFVDHNAGVHIGDTIIFLTQPSPSIATDSVIPIGINHTFAHAFVTLPENVTAQSAGFLWSTTNATPELPTADSTKRVMVVEGTLTDSIPNLIPETHYYIRAYIEHNTGISYGSVLEFVTINTPYAITDSITEIAQSNAIVHAQIKFPDINVEKYGFVYGLDNLVSRSGDHVGFIEKSFVGELIVNDTLTGLNPYTTYYAKAYLAYKIGENEGIPVYSYIESDSILEFKTLAPDFGMVTLPITEYHPKGFTGAGRALQAGLYLPTELGLVISTTENPTNETFDFKQTFNPEEPDYFEFQFAGLTTGTTYYVRAYALFTDYIEYGEQRSIMLPNVFGTMTDIELNTYPTKFIGKLNWSINNLRTNKLANGTQINPVHLISYWDSIVGPDTANVYGKYYHSQAVYNHLTEGKITEKICPAGWRLPLNQDFVDLMNEAVPNPYIAHQLKDTTYNTWLSGFEDPTNETGFAATAIGHVFMQSDTVYAKDAGLQSVMWVDGQQPQVKAGAPINFEKFFNLMGNDATINELLQLGVGTVFMPVRCVQNFEKLPQIAQTIQQEDLNNITAKISYSIVSTGNAENGIRGFVWSTEPNPTLETNEGVTEHELRNGDWQDDYQQQMPFATPIYIRAYAKNTLGTVYSQQLEIQLAEPDLTLNFLPITQTAPTYFVAVGQLINPNNVSFDEVGFILNSNPDASSGTALYTSSITSLDDDLFVIPFNDLPPAQTFYARPYIKIGGFVKYGEQKMVALPEINGTVTDFDNNNYPTKFIGNQNWITRNLRVTKYADGTPIPESEHVLPFWGSDSVLRHGRLYSQNVIANHLLNSPTATICPNGWRLPSDEDWYELMNNATSNPEWSAIYLRDNHGWDSEVSVNDSVGFSALPTGEYYIYTDPEMPEEDYYGINETSYHWSAPTISENTIYSNVAENNRYNSYMNISNWSFTFNGSETDYLPIRCLENMISLPMLSEVVLSDTTHNSFATYFLVNSDGNSTNGQQGVVWSTQQNPTIEQNEGITSNPLKKGDFLDIAEGIVQGVTYYARAYVSNEAGTRYSAQFSFTASNQRSLLDIEGNKYPTIVIGEQEWMMRNLRTHHYTNNKGIEIPNPGNFTYASNGDPQVFGLFYNLNVVSNHLNDGLNASLCPKGWRIPAANDWNTLYATIGDPVDSVGKHLKDTAYVWPTPGANNSSGFAAVPSGYISIVGGEMSQYPEPQEFETNAYFWSEPKENEYGYEAVINRINGMDDSIQTENYNSGIIVPQPKLVPVRCLKSVPQLPELGTAYELDSTKTAISVKYTVRNCGYDETGIQGIVISSEPNPTLETNEKFTSSFIKSGIGIDVIDGLQPLTLYYLKVYVKNSFGIVYSNQLSIQTGDEMGAFDIQGNKYNSVVIGNQEWLRENLRTAKFANGKFLFDFAFPQPGVDSVDTYGLFYDQNSITCHLYDGPNYSLCPSGWRLPFVEDWNNLIAEASTNMEEVAKNIQDTVINWPLGDATNSTGFAAVPSGTSAFVIVQGGGCAPGQPQHSPVLPEYSGHGVTTAFWTEPYLFEGRKTPMMFGIDGMVNTVGLVPYIPDIESPYFYIPVRCVKEGIRPPLMGVNVEYDYTDTEIWFQFAVKSTGFSENGTQGLVWSTLENPTLLENQGLLSEQLVKDTVGYVISGLSPETAYYVKAFAANETDTVYSEQQEIVTSNIHEAFDREGNRYVLATIGSQEWMTQNLRTTKYADWTDIPVESFKIPEDGMDSIEEYGNYYEVAAIINQKSKPNQSVCPTGWRLPDSFDWEELVLSTGAAVDSAGKFLKDTETYWPQPGTNSVGFTAVAAGFWSYEFLEGWQERYAFRNMNSMHWFKPAGSKENPILRVFRIEGFSDTVYSEPISFDSASPEKYAATVRCIKSVYETPELGAVSVDNITHNSANANYQVIKSGFMPDGKCGVVWSINPSPSLEDNQGIVFQYIERGNASQLISNLQPNTQYYLRVFASNLLGTVYSDEIVITTETYTAVFDYEGNEYQTKVIGGQEWMLRNLRTTHYNNGDAIHWNDSIGPQPPHMVYTTYGSDEFGYLYNFGILTDVRGVCPEGFKIPHRDDWLQLFDSVGGIDVAGGILKSTGTEPEEGQFNSGLWNHPNSGATDLVLFNALATGYQSDYGDIYYSEESTRFWSSTLSDIDHTIAYELVYSGEQVNPVSGLNNGEYTSAAYSVRCVKIIPEKKYSATVFTNEITEYTSNSITVSGELYDDGGSTISELGFCYSTDWNPTIEDSKIALGTDPGNFNTVISGLEGLTFYTIRAYAINENGVSYGKNQQVQTLSPYSPPTVKTGTIYLGDINVAEASIEILDDGGKTITEAGLLWGTTRMPTTSTFQHMYSSPTNIGNYTMTLISLAPDTHYFARAYAKNSEGTSYGNEVIFTSNQAFQMPTMMGQTLDSISVVPLYISQNAPWGDAILTGSASLDNGQVNTHAIIAVNEGYNNNHYAAKLCDELRAYGFDDYYLPSITEMDSLYNRRTEFGITTANSIWSSTENNELAYAKSFSSGMHLSYAKNNTGNETFCVRKNIPQFEIFSDVDYGGTISPKGTVRILEGGSVQFSFSVEPWAISHQLWIDGTEEYDSTSTYTFENITTEHDIYLEVVVPEYELTYSAETGGTLSGDSPQYVYHNQNGTAVEAIADLHYVFLKWSDDRTDNPRIDKNVTTNISVTAIFVEGVKDYDGNIYPIVNLGGYIWMTSNLKAVHDQNGDTITGWAYYNNLPENSDTYGLLYEWNNASNPCPQGFEFPTDSDWQGFEQNYLGMTTLEVEATGARGTSGGELKEPTLDYWQSPNSGATNSSGFTALPGGEYIEGTGFTQMGNEAHFWTSDEYDGTNAWYRKLTFDSNAIYRDPAPKTNKKSIRCFKPWF